MAAREKARDLDDQLRPFDYAAHSTKIVLKGKVGYARHFLKSIGCGATDPMWFARGTVTSFVKLGDLELACIKWVTKGQHDLPGKVNVKNLAPVGPNLAFCGS